jgi:uncharacterized protein (DUF4415 family)
MAQAAVILDDARAKARRRMAQQAIMPTQDEDAVIMAAALSDPDTPPLAEGEMATFTPANLTETRRPRGRPVQEVTKVPTTMRLDSDVLDSFKATGDGWQTRVNAALRDHLAAHKMLTHRFHATVQGLENDTERMAEFLVVAIDMRQATLKVKLYLRERGLAKEARGRVITSMVGNARMPELEVIY